MTNSYLIWVKSETPIVINYSTGNYFKSLSYIPASSILGAFKSKLIKNWGGEKENVNVKLILSDAYPSVENQNTLNPAGLVTLYKKDEGDDYYVDGLREIIETFESSGNPKFHVKVYDQRTLSPGKEPIFFEALPPNTRLVSRIIVYNGSLDDLNLLVASLGGTKYGVKIGRGKEKGYGIIKLVEVKIKELLSNSQVDEKSIIQSALNIIQSRWNYAKPAFFT